jgi:hypothetical protein
MPTAPMLARTLFFTLSGGNRRFFGMWPTYSYLGHNPQQQQKSIHELWLEWSTVAAMATYLRRRRIEESPNMLADCRMQRRQEWGTMAAVGRAATMVDGGVF